MRAGVDKFYCAQMFLVAGPDCSAWEGIKYIVAGACFALDGGTVS